MRFAASILVTLILAGLTAYPSSAETIAEFTDISVHGHGLTVSADFTQAQAFEVSGTPTVTEVQLRLMRVSGAAGFVRMQLCHDWDGQPGGVFATVSRHVNEIPLGERSWVSFKWSSSGTQLSPGRLWIVCKLSSGSDANIFWTVVVGNPYGNGGDMQTSTDGGSTWPVLQDADANFKVFGTRTTKSTTTTVAADPAQVATSGVSTIQVTVRDSDSNLVQGPGTVTLTATGGTLGSSEVTLSNGQASTTWTAPGAMGSRTVTAAYNGHSYAGIDYDSSSRNVSIDVVAQQRSTTVAQILNPSSTTTRSQVDVSVTVRDSLDNLVPGGTVSFTCATGAFSPSSVQVVNGQASTTWTADNTTGTFAIQASYSGFDAGTIVYGAQSDSDNVVVDYTDVNTTILVGLSPDYPYKECSSFVKVHVYYGAWQLVPGGTVQLSSSSGWFDDDTITLAGGMGSTKWHAPASIGVVSIGADYQEYTAAGDRYLPIAGSTSANVVVDYDSTGEELSYMLEWISNYSDKPLPNSKFESQGFANKLFAWGWGHTEYCNYGAYEDDMKKSSEGGHENDYMDVHDITWYNGHGNADCISFITDHDDRELEHSDAYDSWGTKDAEWVALHTCRVMSHDSYWASTMNGIHLECGFHTNSESTKTFGKTFAGLMIKENVYDEPHRLCQAWFLAGDLTHDTDKKQRVIGEIPGMFYDYLWGQGYVSIDPTVDDYYHSRSHDVTNLTPPTADAGGDAGGRYAAVAGQIVQFDGSSSSDPDVGDYLFYAWDVQLLTDTDLGDWDNNGVNETFDDADLWGCRPQHVFPDPGTYQIRLMVFDDDWGTSSATAWVDVAPAAIREVASTFAPTQSDGDIEIVDNFSGLPGETDMPLFHLVDATVGYNEMMNIAAYYGMEGPAGLDDLGDWNMVHGENELIVNRYSGSVMYVNRARAYEYFGPPFSLPSDAEAIQVAESFMDANGIDRADAVLEGLTDMFAEETGKGDRSRLSRIPYQRRVNYGRTMQAMGQPYPVVGPGGKITVMIDEYRHIVLFVKVWRDLYEGDETSLFPVEDAITAFHNLGPKALIGSSLIPLCHRIEIDNVSLGYYEEDFVTRQQVVFPVYILDLTCEDDKGSWQQQVYMSAIAAPVEVSIDSPGTGAEVPYGESIDFSGSAVSGTGPYTYEWHSDVDGPLGTGDSINTTLSGSQKEAQAVQHTITLRATDANGMVGESSINVKVLPQTFDHVRQQPDGTQVWLLGPIVTGIFPERYYMELADRSVGIGVLGPTSSLQEGDAMSVSGVVLTVEGERMVESGDWAIASTGNPVPEPLLLRNSFLGGADLGIYTPGIPGAVDLYNLGLLVTTPGVVTAVYSGYFYVDDGCGIQDGTGSIGVRVLCDEYQPLAGSYAVVTGVSGAEDAGGWIIPVLRARGQDDIVIPQ